MGLHRVHWYISTLGFWDPARRPTFQIVPGTLWWSGADWISGNPIPYNGQVLVAAQTSNHRVLPDFFKIGEKIAVSKRFYDIVDTLEPGVHQFFPVKLLRKKGDELSGQYSLFNVTKSLDCIDSDKSDLAWKDWSGMGAGGQQSQFKRLSINTNAGLVLREERVRGHHLFRSSGEDELKGCLFFSEELMRAAREARLSGIFEHPTHYGQSRTGLGP